LSILQKVVLRLNEHGDVIETQNFSLSRKLQKSLVPGKRNLVFSCFTPIISRLICCKKNSWGRLTSSIQTGFTYFREK